MPWRSSRLRLVVPLEGQTPNCFGNVQHSTPGRSQPYAPFGNVRERYLAPDPVQPRKEGRLQAPSGRSQRSRRSWKRCRGRKRGARPHGHTWRQPRRTLEMLGVFVQIVSSTRINFTPILAVSIVCQEIKPVFVPLCLFLTGHLNIHKFWVSLVLMWKSRDTRLQGLLVRDSPERQAYNVNSRYIS